jgi:rSAM/selenodomain-associated transferase 2
LSIVRSVKNRIKNYKHSAPFFQTESWPANSQPIAQFTNPMMSISVIIPSINEERRIGRAINSAWQAGASEVIVADGGSGDLTVEHAKALGCRVLLVPAGRGVQQHQAACVAEGDVLVFLHADNQFNHNCLQQISQNRKGRTRFFGFFRQRILDNRGRYRWIEQGNLARASLLRLVYGDQTIVCDRDFYFELGGFPQDPLMEDVSFSLAAARKTRPVVLPGPVMVDARRWQRRGLLRQTLTNWSLLARYACGTTPAELARAYRKHDG